VYGTVSELVTRFESDVLVDFTSAAVVAASASAAVEAGIHLVIGTSGLTAEDYRSLDDLARQHQVGVIAAGNFSLMAALLQRFAAQAAEHLTSWEIIDYADAGKLDVPSGTSRALAERLGEVRAPHVQRRNEELAGLLEARGAEVAGTHVHSVRLPGYYVSTDVVFASPSERLVLRHEPGSGAEPYIAGTLLAIRRVMGIRGVLRGLDQLLSSSRPVVDP
jgi:4-hydroxy-tetrahydrodipicolinate reductase